jgi:hypothetical protein
MQLPSLYRVGGYIRLQFAGYGIEKLEIGFSVTRMS